MASGGNVWQFSNRWQLPGWGNLHGSELVGCDTFNTPQDAECEGDSAYSSWSLPTPQASPGARGAVVTNLQAVANSATRSFSFSHSTRTRDGTRS